MEFPAGFAAGEQSEAGSASDAGVACHAASGRVQVLGGAPFGAAATVCAGGGKGARAGVRESCRTHERGHRSSGDDGVAKGGGAVGPLFLPHP